MEDNQQITRRHFHSILRRYRHQAGLTQEQMAERMNVSVGFFGMMEVGRRWPNIDMLLKIAGALNVRPGELIDALDVEREMQGGKEEARRALCRKNEKPPENGN